MTPDPESTFDLRLVLRVLRTRALLVLLVAAAVAGGVAAWSAQLPSIYQAVCTIEYNPNPPRPLGREVEDVGDPVQGYFATREYFETQNRILESRRIAALVADRLQLQDDPDYGGGIEDADEALLEAAHRVRATLRIEPVEGTRLVEIHVRDQNAERAASIANAVADAYIAKTHENRMRSTVDAANWLQTALRDRSSELSETELALHEFKREHDILSVSMEHRQNLVASNIEQYNQQLNAARSRRIELSAHLQRVRDVASADEDEFLEASGSLEQEGAIAELRTQLVSKVAERDSLSQRYGAAHPEMVRLNQEISAIANLLRGEVRGILAAAEARLAEVRRIEGGLAFELQKANEAGHELNRWEIDYNQLQRDRENQAEIIGHLLQRQAETRMVRSLDISNVDVVDYALTPDHPISPRIAVNVAIGIILGLVFGVLAALAMHALDRRVKGTEDVESFGVNVLGVLPEISQPGRGGRAKGTITNEGRDLVVNDAPMSVAAESFRTLRTNLIFASADTQMRSIVITSPNPREGKTTVALNLAASMAQRGKKVVLVDTDLRRPRVHHVFGVRARTGLTNVLVGDHELEPVPTHITNLDVVPCGPIPPNPAELLHSQSFIAAHDLLREKYDLVIFDSPPITAVTDGAVLAPQTDGVLLVIKSRETTRDGLANALRSLSNVGAHILGVVVNSVDRRHESYGYYNGRTGYYYSSPDDEDDGTVDDDSDLAQAS